MKGSVCMFYFEMKFVLQMGEGEKREECKFQNKAHRTFVSKNSFTPVSR